MGPISQGTLNDLNNLAVLVQSLSAPEGIASVVADLKAQMDAVVTKGAEVAERESVLDSREAAVVAAEDRYRTLLVGVEGKNADAEKRLNSATLRLAVVVERETALADAMIDFDQKVTSAGKEISDREEAAATKEAEVAELWRVANEAKVEYEGKLAQLKSIAG